MLSSQNMRGFDHATILSTVSARNACTMTCLLCPKNSGGYFQKNWEGVCGTLLEIPTLFQTKICDLKPWSPGRGTSCYSTYTVVGVNI